MVGGAHSALIVVVLAALAAGSTSARSQPVDSPACRRECGATSTTRGLNPNSVQACLIRCGANASFLRQQRSGTGGTNGRGITPTATTAAAYAAAQPTPQRALQPSPDASRSSGLRYGAIYTGAPPSTGLGLTFGQADRISAHRVAENDCLARGRGAPCRLAIEFTESCGAVVQGVRLAEGAFVISSDPTTYRVVAFGHGTGPSRLVAEQQAMADCNRRDRALVCRVARSGCGG